MQKHWLFVRAKAYFARLTAVVERASLTAISIILIAWIVDVAAALGFIPVMP